MTNASRRPQDLSGNPDIRIIGPQASGKTAFLAALARWPNDGLDSPIQSVDPFDDGTVKLIDMAKDILEHGLPMAGTLYPEDPNNSMLYSILLQLKPSFTTNPIAAMTGRNLRFQVSCREYSGEFVNDLRKGGDRKLSDYLDECAEVLGLLVLIDGTAKQDEIYAQALTRLQAELKDRLLGTNRRLANYRVAIVFSKAEQAQVWSHRHNIHRFMSLKFPQTQATFAKWTRDWGNEANYFFCSAFGMRGAGVPNVKVESRGVDGTFAMIDKTKFWRPFGLVAPIYWLHTGKDDQRLRKFEV